MKSKDKKNSQNECSCRLREHCKSRKNIRKERHTKAVPSTKSASGDHHRSKRQRKADHPGGLALVGINRNPVIFAAGTEDRHQIVAPLADEVVLAESILVPHLIRMISRDTCFR